MIGCWSGHVVDEIGSFDGAEAHKRSLFVVMAVVVVEVKLLFGKEKCSGQTRVALIEQESSSSHGHCPLVGRKDRLTFDPCETQNVEEKNEADPLEQVHG